MKKIFPNIKITKCKQTGAIYIYIGRTKTVKGCVKKTVEVANNIYVDLDDKGEAVGVEIL